MKIYAVEQGSYEDYRIIGVFSTQANAQRVADVINLREKYEEATIVKWDMDPFIVDMDADRHPYRVEMDIDGGVERLERETGIPKECMRVWERTGMTHFNARDDTVVGVVWANNDRHAVEKVNEYRLKALAEGRMRRLVQ